MIQKEKGTQTNPLQCIESVMRLAFHVDSLRIEGMHSYKNVCKT